MRRWSAIALTALLGIMLGACSDSGSDSAPPEGPPGGAWPKITAYYQSQPPATKKGWQRGILVDSNTQKYKCMGGACSTWKGTAIRRDGKPAALESNQGQSVVGTIIHRGDDFWWKDNYDAALGTTSVTFASEVILYRQGAVDLDTSASTPSCKSKCSATSTKRLGAG